MTTPPLSPKHEMDLSSFPSTADLLERCRAWLHRYLVLSPAQVIVIAVWVLHTWSIDAAEFTPYLHITAPEKGCGKTRLLEVLRAIVYKPWFTGRVTAGALVRKIAKDKPSLLLDESDAAFRGDVIYTEALRGILNSGYSRSGYSSLCVGKGTEVSTVDFSCFGPKALAGIGDLPDTVASRSIVIAMRRKTASEHVGRFREHDVRVSAEQFRAMLEAWATPATIEALRIARPELPEEMTDRQMDISEPLIAIADLAGGVWTREVRAALLELFGSTASEDSSIGVQLLRDIRSIFDEHGIEAISSAHLAEALCKIEGQPWAERMNGKGINPSGLARLLKKHGVAPRTIRFDALTTLKGYTRDSFRDAWDRYCPPAAVTSVTPVTTRANIEDLQCEMPSHSRHEGAFAAQKAAFSPPCFTRNVSAAPHAENLRQSTIVTDVTAVTPITGMVEAEPSIATLAWKEVGGGDAPSLPATPITPPLASAAITKDDSIESDL